MPVIAANWPPARPDSSAAAPQHPAILTFPFSPAADSAPGRAWANATSATITYLIDGSFWRAETIWELLAPLATSGIPTFSVVTLHAEHPLATFETNDSPIRPR